CGPRGARRPRLFERSVEVPTHGRLERAAKCPVVHQEAPARVGQAHAAARPAARGALGEFEAGRLLELTQVAPRVAIRHLELRRRLLQRAARVDGLEQPRAAVAELQLIPERDPDPQLGFHIDMGAPKWPPNPQPPAAPPRSRRPPPLPPPRRAQLAPQPPALGSAPAQPGPSSITVVARPRNGPQTPSARKRPGAAGALLDYARAASKWPSNPNAITISRWRGRFSPVSSAAR